MTPEALERIRAVKRASQVLRAGAWRAAEATDRDRAHGKPGARQGRGDEIKPGAMAADDDEIGHAHMRRVSIRLRR